MKATTHTTNIAPVRVGHVSEALATIRQELPTWIELGGGSTVGTQWDAVAIGYRALDLMATCDVQNDPDLMAERFAAAGLTCAWCVQADDPDGDDTIQLGTIYREGEGLLCSSCAVRR